MNLHQNKALFRNAVLAASQQFCIPEIYVEKDYWATLVLNEIFHSDMADQIVFKGGTCLSKCHKLIQRFSEDIDLVVFRNKDEKDNQLKKKIRQISKIVEKILPEIHVEGLTNKKGNIRKTVHQYDRFFDGTFDGTFDNVREQLILESTWLGNYEPFTIESVGSYILDVMHFTGQDTLIKEYGLHSFKVQALSVERTFCEKIMSLVRFSRTEEPFVSLSNKIRHIYDLHLMLKNKSINSFFKSDDFSIMLQKVGKDDFISYKNNNAWLKDPPCTAVIFEKPDMTWHHIRNTYWTIFKDLVLGDLPSEKDLIATLVKIEKKIKLMDWIF